MAMVFATDINPDTTATRSLGDSTHRFKINGIAYDTIAVSVPATNSTTVTISDSAITASHNVITNVMPIEDDIDWSTSTGSLTLTKESGTIPAMTLVLCASHYSYPT